MGSQAVVYLARGASAARMSVNGPISAAEFGRRSAEAFFDHYRSHAAGVAHELVVVLKGWTHEGDREQVRRWAQGCSATVLEFPDDGFDWGAYFRVASVLTSTWVCFLNTHSRPIGDGWLDALVSAAAKPGIGAVGATGSWGSITPRLPPPEWDARELLLYPARLAHSVVEFATSIHEFPLFPNPHLRSNGFLFRRELFVAFAQQRHIPREKRDTHRLESGRAGLPRFLRERGVVPLVVGRDGRQFEPEQWIASGTFRVPGQPNLAIEDNQTDFYRLADRFRRRRLERVAWGRTFTP